MPSAEFTLRKSSQNAVNLHLTFLDLQMYWYGMQTFVCRHQRRVGFQSCRPPPFFQGLLLLLLVAASVASIDEFMTCDRILEKKRTARLLDEIPCDMGAKSYCEHKGKGYPE